MFEVDRWLGGGGFASVYLAHHKFLLSQHALKVLSSELVSDLDVRDRFLAEARILAQLQHPNLLRVTDILIEPGVAALVMEYVDGPTLEAELAASPDGKPVAWAKELMGPLLDAVGYAHAQGIIHRDLKPANILLARTHERALRPVVIDFGIAHLQADARVSGRRTAPTQVGAQIGTPAYMSPEQVRGAELDARSDVFALGAILYEVLTGASAFEGESAFDVQRAIVDGRWTPLRARRPALPAALDAVLGRALATDPNHRYASCRALRDALDAAWTAPVEVVARPVEVVAPPAVEARPVIPQVFVPPAPRRAPRAVAPPLPPAVPSPPPVAEVAPAAGTASYVLAVLFGLIGGCAVPCVGVLPGALIGWYVGKQISKAKPG